MTLNGLRPGRFLNGACMSLNLVKLNFLQQKKCARDSVRGHSETGKNFIDTPPVAAYLLCNRHFAILPLIVGLPSDSTAALAPPLRVTR